jgi:hypothetical protein
MSATTICRASIHGGDICAGKQDCMWTRAACHKDSSPEVEYNEKRICVAGKITEYRGVPEVSADTPAQIAVENSR